MIRATDHAVSPPLRIAAPFITHGPAETGALLPIRVCNRSLPASDCTAPPAASGALSWRRILLAVGTLAALGSVAYWTFGQPMFAVGSRAAAPPPAPESGGARRVVDWAALDRVWRKSVG